ncbi:ferrochelatase [Kordiimonas sp. SCSIO 12603]|uniref:ferrochelatase n=1 Tax=Kordiimonas sp. SCSIO 12603 TaxID=2829596 RepID=UPI002105CD50|nr:ferrochelatase [Kordiimonas sp. SCSIO 12603]UTW58514.1 ferrochelatase [Kordiimonas sp. SCSIO 12603]
MKNEHPQINHGKIGVLLISLGTPDAPTYGAVRKYLAEFLSDPRVIEVPKLAWLPILYGPILTFRPMKSAKAYAKIWDYERMESPLRTYSRSQAEKMQDHFGDSLHVEWAFRYGTPSIETGLQALKEKGCDRIVLFALYPQYSATSTATAYDKAFDVLKSMRWQPSVRTVPAYYDETGYIEALAQTVDKSLGEIDWEPEHILASYHSIPNEYFEKGDPYPCQCRKTSRLLSEKLKLEQDKLVTSFQSRVGPTKWVGPYTDKTVEELAKSGVKKLAVLAPAFSSDCLETLEEINMELRETFLEAGGTHFHYIPCLNDTALGMKVLNSVTEKELAGWLK